MVQKLAPNHSLLKTLVAIHIVYNTVKGHVQQFHQLVSLEPRIIEVLGTTVPYPANEMVCLYIVTHKIGPCVFFKTNFNFLTEFSILCSARNVRYFNSKF